MIRIAIVEDDKADYQHFVDVYNRYCSRLNIENEITHFLNGEDFLATKCNFDLVFMDIELPGKNGIEISKELRTTNNNIIIVFLTNIGKYAINGYEVSALDYILKPITELIFDSKMNRFIEAINKKHEINDTIILNKGKHIIKLNNIVYVEIYNHDLTYHTDFGDFTHRGTLKEIENKTYIKFSRPNNFSLVNLSHVIGINKFDLKLDNGVILQISRNRKKEFLDDFSKYIGLAGENI